MLGQEWEGSSRIRKQVDQQPGWRDRMRIGWGCGSRSKPQTRREHGMDQWLKIQQWCQSRCVVTGSNRCALPLQCLGNYVAHGTKSGGGGGVDSPPQAISLAPSTVLHTVPAPYCCSNKPWTFSIKVLAAVLPSTVFIPHPQLIDNNSCYQRQNSKFTVSMKPSLATMFKIIAPLSHQWDLFTLTILKHPIQFSFSSCHPQLSPLKSNVLKSE